MKDGNRTGGFGQPDKGEKKAEMVSKGRLTSANNTITKLQERAVSLKLKGKKYEKQLVRTAHSAGQHATTLTVASTLSYTEGATLVGGLIAEGMGHETAGGYAQAFGAGAVLSDVCSSARDAGVRMRAENQAKAQKAEAQPAAEAPKADPLLEKMQATPAETPAAAAGVRRGPPQQQRRAKHRVEPDRRAPTVPPHLAHLLRESRAA